MLSSTHQTVCRVSPPQRREETRSICQYDKKNFRFPSLQSSGQPASPAEPQNSPRNRCKIATHALNQFPTVPFWYSLAATFGYTRCKRGLRGSIRIRGSFRSRLAMIYEVGEPLCTCQRLRPSPALSNRKRHAVDKYKKT